MPEPRRKLQVEAEGQSAGAMKLATRRFFSNSGKRFCEDFQTGGCCAGQKCQKAVPEVHSCNFVDADGKLCGRTGKRRQDHPH